MKNNKGQILIEVMIGLFVVVVVFGGIMSLFGTTVGMTRVVADQYVGTYLASEGVEIVKNIIDKNYHSNPQRAFNAGMSNGSVFEADYQTEDNLTPVTGDLRKLKFDGAFYGYAGGEDTSFTRKIEIGGSGDTITVLVTVAWEGKGGDYEVQVGDTFKQWWK